jgi:UTP--glucose-1-phosphate uridylyltransferase
VLHAPASVAPPAARGHRARTGSALVFGLPPRPRSDYADRVTAADIIAGLGVGADTRAQLERYGFDPAAFQALRRRLTAAPAGGHQQDNVVRGHIEPPRPEDLYELPPAGSDARAGLAARGEQAIAAGEVGVVVLAGGMATRFGGGVKAAVEVLPGRSFLDLKLADVRAVQRRLGGRVPVTLLVSFATEEVIAALAAQATTPEVPVEVVAQFISLRLDAAGDIFREADGSPSPYAPGHGDLTFALRAAGALGRFRAAGGRVLAVSNVDNLAATLDPAVIGAHLARGQAVTVEAVRCEPGDVGGAPARVDGHLQIVEAFRFPPEFPQHTLPVFNTNTFVMDAAAIDRDFDLSWFYVKKQVDGREVIQFERLVGEVTAFLPTGLLVVPRHPPESRFQPIKDPADLEHRRGAIRDILRARGVIG